MLASFRPSASPPAAPAFARYAWGVVAYMILVILWGAFVRATGSGAGCGSHWPLCNGEVIPRAPEVETLIELSHRLTSAFAGVLVIALTAWAFRAFPKGSAVRKAAVGSLVFVVTEGAIGALIVLFEWVAFDASLARTISIALHLNNTFVLLAFLTATAWWASGGRVPRWRGQGAVGWMLGGVVLAVGVVSTAGALTALGDTLFKVASSGEALSRMADAAAHHLERLRVVHPVLAVALGAGLVFAIPAINERRPDALAARYGRLVLALYFAQLALGFLNVFLQAPVWMQLVHLLVADGIWIALLVFANAALAARLDRARAVRAPLPPSLEPPVAA